MCCVQKRKGNSARPWTLWRVFAYLLCLSLVANLIPSSLALADVKRTDLVLGTTVSERGLTPSSCPSIDAEYAYLVTESGEVLFERNAYEHTNIASITKVMTAIVALENASLNDEITVSQKAASIGESTAGLRAGDIITLENAIKGLMIPSGNDAAYAIAETVGQTLLDNASSNGESIISADGEVIDGTAENAAFEAFVAKMNEKAQDLGCNDTLFDNPHGLDYGSFAGDMYSCARDVSVMVAYAMQLEVFRDTVCLESAKIPVVRSGESIEISLESTDLLIGNYDGACGVKTGYTELAGPCFAAACTRDNTMLYAVVLNSSSEAQRFTDSETLFDWYYNNQINYKLANSSETIQMTLDGEVKTVPVVANVALSDWKDKTIKATFEDSDASVSVFSINGNVSQRLEFYDVSGQVSAGQTVGIATFYQNNTQIAKVNIIACEDVSAPGLLESASVAFAKFINIFTHNQIGASTEVLNDTPLILDKN